MEKENKQIDAYAFPIKEILSKQKYTVDFFQRNYSWKSENIEQLVTDLVDAFCASYKEGDSSKSIDNYDTYYMGPIVVCEKDKTKSLVDGQQRITSLTLLLIYLYHKTEALDVVDKDLIYSKNRDEYSFNIDVPERNECLKGLFEKGSYTPKENEDPSVFNMVERYTDIEDVFPNELADDPQKLKMFVWWLLDNVILVKITAHSDKNSYLIFETMNDRGLNLSPTDMLKGFILSKFENPQLRKKYDDQWKQDCLKLSSYGKNVDAQFFQSWLRAQFAETIRQSAAGSQNMDFENIGLKFHSWFRDSCDKGLLKDAINNSIEHFMASNYDYYLKLFKKIKDAELELQPNLEHVFYCKHWGIAESLKYPLLLAPVLISDSEEVAFQKIDAVARFIDCFCVRRSVNYRLFGASSLRYTMSALTREIRGKTLDQIKPILNRQIDDNSNDFESLSSFRMHQKNKSFVKYFLARLTSFVETGSGEPNRFSDYICNPHCKPFEIEHIWCDHFEEHNDEFDQLNDFNDCRNNIGDLLLLPNGSNQSYGDLPYKEKVPHYIKENLLAKTLCKETYDHNPNFIKFVKQNKICVEAKAEFKKKDILDRCRFYKQLCEIIWKKFD